MTFGDETLKILDRASNSKKISPQLFQTGRRIGLLIDCSICYNPLSRDTLRQFLFERRLWRNFWRPNAFHEGLLNRNSPAFRIPMTIGMYLHMDSLTTTSLQPTVPTGQSTPVPDFKSGNRTPAPLTKVLRWKDLEAAVIEGHGGTPGSRTPFTIPSGGVEEMEARPDGDESDIEDLFM
jgi:hypothetical protein